MLTDLSPDDIKKIKYAGRTGILITTGFFILGLTGLLYKITGGNSNKDFLPLKHTEILELSGLLLFTSLLFLIVLNRKYFLDLRNGKKEVIRKTVQKKLLYKDHEPGSGSLWIRQKMKSFDSYNIIIDDQRYNVTKELYDRLEENGFVFFHIAPASQEILKIDTAEN
jgi:hypothetical protein